MAAVYPNDPNEEDHGLSIWLSGSPYEQRWSLKKGEYWLHVDPNGLHLTRPKEDGNKATIARKVELADIFF